MYTTKSKPNYDQNLFVLSSNLSWCLSFGASAILSIFVSTLTLWELVQSLMNIIYLWDQLVWRLSCWYTLQVRALYVACAILACGLCGDILAEWGAQWDSRCVWPWVSSALALQQVQEISLLWQKPPRGYIVSLPVPFGDTGEVIASFRKIMRYFMNVNFASEFANALFRTTFLSVLHVLLTVLTTY